MYLPKLWFCVLYFMYGVAFAQDLYQDILETDPVLFKSAISKNPNENGNKIKIPVNDVLNLAKNNKPDEISNGVDLPSLKDILNTTGYLSDNAIQNKHSLRLKTQPNLLEGHVRVRRQDNPEKASPNDETKNSTNPELKEESKTNEAQNPVRFHIETEDESSKTEERGGQADTQRKKSISGLNLPGFSPIGLLKTGATTAQETAKNIGEFASKEYNTLRDGLRQTIGGNENGASPLGGLLFGGLDGAVPNSGFLLNKFKISS